MSRQICKQVQSSRPAHSFGQKTGGGLLSALAFVLMMAGGHAAADEVCPARPLAMSDGPAKTRTPGKLSPMARRLYDADVAYDAGNYDLAESKLLPLSHVRADRNDTAHRAYLRLARIRAQQGRWDEAKTLAAKAGKSRLRKVRRQAQSLLSDITYREGVSQAKGAFDQADKLLKAGDVTGSEAAFKPLLTQPCPVPAAYSDRVKLKLATISLKKGNLDEASTWLGSINRSADPDLAAQAAGIDVTLAQKRVDVAARSAFEAADLRVDTGDFAGAVAADQAALSAYPNASTNVVIAGKLGLADHQALAGLFGDARATVASITFDGVDPDLVGRRDRVVQRIDAREMDAQVSKLMVQAESDRAASRPLLALATYDAIVANPAYSPEWQQRAQLRRASINRQRFAFSAAKADIDAVAAAPATPSIATNVKSAADDFAAATPNHLLTGAVNGGLQYDDNAPVIVSAVPGEDDTVPYPGNEKFSDAATVVGGSVDYRHRIGSQYNYLTASAGIDIVDQWTLDPLDRAKLATTLGVEFPISAWTAKAEAGALYDRTYRGGKLLNQGAGGYVTYTQIMGSRRLEGHYEVEHMDDRRVGRDGWRQTLSAQVSPARGGYGLTGGISLLSDRPTDPSLRQASISLSGSYVRRLRTAGNWQVDGSIAGSVRSARYDETSLDAKGNSGHRTTVRTRFEVGPTLVYREKTEFRISYVHLGIDDSAVNYDRNDNQIYVSVQRRF